MEEKLTLNELKDAYYTGLVDKEYPSKNEYQPSLVFNNHKKGNNVLSNIEKQLRYCTEFYFSVAFITKDGIVCLKNILKELEEKGIKGKILTTNYLGFNNPLALQELLNYKNLEIKVYEGDFHVKGYFFKMKDSITFMSGSSNLTQNALKNNKEWNIKISSFENGKLVFDALNEFNEMWNETHSKRLTKEWIDKYSIVYEASLALRTINTEGMKVTYELIPNKMQEDALGAIQELRNKSQKKGIIISSTGERVIIVTGCINALRSRVSGTLVNMIHALLRVIKYNYCKQCMRSKDVLALQY